MDTNNFHRVRNKIAGRWDHEDLQYLAKALGFPLDVFLRASPIESLSSYVTTEKLIELCENGVFHNVLDKTYNLHSAEWNTMALQKVINMVDRKMLSFVDTYTVYLAYKTNEIYNLSGVPVDGIPTLMATFKMCGRTISPEKLAHRLKHAKKHYVKEGFIQFHEMLDLILWTEPTQDLRFERQQKPITKKVRGMYLLDDEREYLMSQDDFCQQVLDQLYRREEFAYDKPTRYIFEQQPNYRPIVNQDLRRGTVQRLKKSRDAMKTDIAKANRTLMRARANGGVLRNDAAANNDETSRKSAKKVKSANSGRRKTEEEQQPSSWAADFAITMASTTLHIDDEESSSSPTTSGIRLDGYRRTASSDGQRPKKARSNLTVAQMYQQAKAHAEMYEKS